MFFISRVPLLWVLKWFPSRFPCPYLDLQKKHSCSFFQAVKYLPVCSHHLSSGTGEPKNRQSKKARLPSVTLMYSFLDPKIRGVASGQKKKYIYWSLSVQYFTSLVVLLVSLFLKYNFDCKLCNYTSFFKQVLTLLKGRMSPEPVWPVILLLYCLDVWLWWEFKGD